jgi:Chaperone of endosialidase
MKTLTNIIYAAFALFAFACFALSPTVKAVTPPPDGGYPGGNTAEGQNALLSLTTGGFNTAVGFYALFANTTGYFNTALGAGALDLNTTGTGNTASGAAALLLNTTGDGNTAVGASALILNFTGAGNTAVGAYALLSNNGDPEAQRGSLNTAIGVEALTYNTTGFANTAVGAGSAENDLKAALGSNTTGDNNTAIGRGALGRNTQGENNTAVGAIALAQNTTGSNNTVVGHFAGNGLTTGNGNIDIGNSGEAGEWNTIRIGTDNRVTPTPTPSPTANAQPRTPTGSPTPTPTPEPPTRTFIAGISGTAVVGDAVVVAGNGQLGTVASAARFKKDIRPMDKTSEAIFAVRPVAFEYKSDSKGTPQFGLIAEEVAKVNPNLVVRDKDGQIYSVRYDAVNAMLLNEFLKEHAKVEQLKKDFESKIAEQQKQIETLSSDLQKVSAQLELNKAAPQTVRNNH